MFPIVLVLGRATAGLDRPTHREGVLGVPEVIVIHRNTKAVELYVRGATEYERVAPAPDGWVAVTVLDTAFCTEANPAGGATILRLRRVRVSSHEGTA